MIIKNFGDIAGLTVKAVYKGDRKASFNSGNWNRNLVSFVYNKKTISFSFWGSIMNPEIVTKEDLEGAVKSILLDAITGKEYQFYDDISGTQEIINEFGYFSQKEAKRVFKGVVKTYEKFEKLFGYYTPQTLYKIDDNLIYSYFF